MIEEKRLAYKKAQAAIQAARKEYDAATARWNEARLVWKWACQEYYPESRPELKEEALPVELVQPHEFGLLRTEDD